MGLSTLRRRLSSMSDPSSLPPSPFYPSPHFKSASFPTFQAAVKQMEGDLKTLMEDKERLEAALLEEQGEHSRTRQELSKARAELEATKKRLAWLTSAAEIVRGELAAVVALVETLGGRSGEEADLREAAEGLEALGRELMVAQPDLGGGEGRGLRETITVAAAVRRQLKVIIPSRLDPESLFLYPPSPCPLNVWAFALPCHCLTPSFSPPSPLRAQPPDPSAFPSLPSRSCPTALLAQLSLLSCTPPPLYTNATLGLPAKVDLSPALCLCVRLLDARRPPSSTPPLSVPQCEKRTARSPALLPPSSDWPVLPATDLPLLPPAGLQG